jgi:hypothetical protein
MALGGQMQEFAQQQLGVAKQEAARRSLREGQEAHIRGTHPEFADEDVFFGRDNAIAYNKGLAHSYISDVSNSNRLALANAETENMEDTQGYINAATSYRNGVMQGIDPKVAVEVQQSLDEQITLGTARVTRREFEATRKENRAISDQNIETLAQDAAAAAYDLDMAGVQQAGKELIGALDRGLESKLYKQSEVDKIKKSVSDEITTKGKLGELEQILQMDEGIAKAVEYIDKLRNTEVTGLDETAHAKMVTRLEARVSDANTSRTTILNNRSAETLVDMNELVVDAQTGKIDQDTAIARGVAMHDEYDMSSGELAKLFTTLRARGEKQAEDDQAKADVMIRFGNPGHQTTQKGVDLFWDEHYQKRFLEAPTTADRNASAASFIEAQRKIPTVVKNQVINDIYTGDPQAVGAAIDLIDRIDNVPGLDVFAGFSKEERAYAGAVKALMASMSAEEAVKIANQQTDMSNKPLVEARDEQIKIWNRPGKNNRDFKNYAEIVSDEYGFTTGSINESTAAAEYKDVFESLYRLGSGEEYAHETALRVVGTNWKEDAITGRTYKYPVQTYVTDYGLVRKDMMASVSEAVKLNNEAGGVNFIGFDVKPENVILYSDERTAREASAKQPTYLVALFDPDTERFVNLTGFRWRPPYEQDQAVRQDPQALVDAIRRQSQETLSQRKRQTQQLSELSSLGVL